MSTNIPPQVVNAYTLKRSAGSNDAAAGIQSTNQPPAAQTQALLAALADGAALASGDFWRLLSLLDLGDVRSVPRGSPPPVEPDPEVVQERADELSRLRGQSPDVLLMLLAARAWGRLQPSTAGRWDAQVGAPALRIADGKTEVVNVAARPAAAYLASVNAVAKQLDPSPQARHVALSQVDAPFLWLPLCLGMHRSPSKFPLSSLLVDATHAVVNVQVQRLKDDARVPRPDQLTGPGAGFKPLIRVPGFTAYPGGHAALMHALAAVLATASGCDAAARGELEAQADKVALLRERMGLHCAEDTAAGRAIGQALGAWLCGLADGADPVWAAVMHGARQEW